MSRNDSIADVHACWNTPHVKQPLKSFCKAVAVGTLAGGILPMVLTVPLAIADLIEPMAGQRRWLADAYLAFLPILVSFALVLPTSIVVGLPIHLLLQWRSIGTQRVYVTSGAIVGVVVTLAMLLAIGAVAGYWTVLLGAFSGGMTALVWWNSLEAPAPRQGA